jgi:hypothetical protein
LIFDVAKNEVTKLFQDGFISPKSDNHSVGPVQAVPKGSLSHFQIFIPYQDQVRTAFYNPSTFGLSKRWFFKLCNHRLKRFLRGPSLVDKKVAKLS